MILGLLFKSLSIFAFGHDLQRYSRVQKDVEYVVVYKFERFFSLFFHDSNPIGPNIHGLKQYCAEVHGFENISQ